MVATMDWTAMSEWRVCFCKYGGDSWEPVAEIGSVRRVRLIQSVPNTFRKGIAAAEYFDFQVIQILAVDDDLGVSLMAGALDVLSGHGVYVLNRFDCRLRRSVQLNFSIALDRNRTAGGRGCEPLPFCCIKRLRTRWCK
jgi:hypothetical protein